MINDTTMCCCSRTTLIRVPGRAIGNFWQLTGTINYHC